MTMSAQFSQYVATCMQGPSIYNMDPDAKQALLARLAQYEELDEVDDADQDLLMQAEAEVNDGQSPTYVPETPAVSWAEEDAVIGAAAAATDGDDPALEDLDAGDEPELKDDRGDRQWGGL
jgi:hypothetical protein